MRDSEGRLWKPAPGGSMSWQEVEAERGLFAELHRQAQWNPWVLDDRAEELAVVHGAMEAWKRAEPDHRYITPDELEASWAALDEKREAQLAAERSAREARAERYSPVLERARLSLIESASRLAFEMQSLEDLRTHLAYPAMQQTRRSELIGEAESNVARLRARVDELSTELGDPEEVVDKLGYLPRERRELMLSLYSARRHVRVKELRRAVAEGAGSPKDRAARETLDGLKREVATLEAVPELMADDMCSECPTPYSDHGWSTLTGPCNSWPGVAERNARAREMIRRFARDKESAKGEPRRTARRPVPLATIPEGLSVEETATLLTELSRLHPGAVVRRTGSKIALHPPESST